MNGKKLRVGMMVSRYPIVNGQGEAFIGRVIYIHPRKRFHMVEFGMPRGMSIRECFFGVNVEPEKAHIYARADATEAAPR